MLLGILPLLALQIQAIADTMHILTVSRNPTVPMVGTGFTFKDLMAMAYCAVLALFTILFGSSREQHRGLVTAMAFESLLKVFALCAIGLRSEEHTSELQSRGHLVCRLLLVKKIKTARRISNKKSKLIRGK